ncbi:WXG100 family type VII secretion target [Longispora sp. NPDC051575]|uniref:WXG100 family type VII secretion target n=1 Tax=Longispora sp. NPDC051575 TaxID=3154943 RepID=UPI0034475BF1
MTDNQLVVDFAALQAGSADIAAAVSKLTASLDLLNQHAAPLVATWDGDAKVAYAARQQKWTTAADDIKTMLNAIKTAVDTSVGEYLRTEKANTGLFS